MKKYDAAPPLPQRRDFTPLFADLVLPAAGLVLGVTVAAFILGVGVPGLTATLAVFGGWSLGAVAPRLYPHRFRVLGWVPVAAGLAFATSLVTVALGGFVLGTLAAFAFFVGAASGAALRYREKVPDHRATFYLAGVAGLAAAFAVGWAFVDLAEFSGEARGRLAASLPWLAGGFALLSVPMFGRSLVELIVDPWMRSHYYCTATGPGLKALPMGGPVLVIANHAAFLDPFFVAEALPRAITPMMTASVYDKPVIRFLMRRVFHVIRVPEITARRSAPETQEAIDALDHGKCVVLFPEGYLRRTEEQVIRRFGRGVWNILSARPDTPVVACWVEGTWGSYFSYFNGPPAKNKPKDRRRPVRIGVSVPLVVPKELLTDHLKTRFFLMNQVLAARAHLDLPEVPAVHLPSQAAVGAGEDD
jgi:1-acyl-sn-glycerol-3-phosphate acyltransferase